jgi:hypothetical protein
MYATFKPKDWPGRVVPETEVHIATAVEALCERAQWHDADRAEITAVVLRWFDRGWCVDAILRAVDLKPDGRLQKRKSAKHEPHLFLRDRLRFWFSDADGEADSATDPLPPPVQGMSFAVWWAINRRNERANRQRRRRSRLGDEGEQARRQAFEFTRGLRRDSIATARDKGRRQAEALDGLLPEGATQHPVERSRRSVRRRSVNRQVCGWVARRAVVANDTDVLRALQAITDSAGTPSRESVERLRNAIRAARWKAHMATIEAMTTPSPDGATPQLSREARRILHYVDQAVEDNLPFNVIVFMLRNGLPMNAG